MCDVIVVLQDGRLMDMGRYDDLIKREGTFTDIIRSFVEKGFYEDQPSGMYIVNLVFSMLLFHSFGPR